jgi:hypothetical protein
MKSIAAYYVLVAMNTEMHEAEQRRAELAAARPSRPSLVERVRSFVTSVRPTRPAAEPA